MRITDKEKAILKNAMEKILVKVICENGEALQNKDGSLFLSAEWVKEFTNRQKEQEEMFKAFDQIFKNISQREHGRPELRFTYPENEVSFEQFKEWFNDMESYKRNARWYEEDKEPCCCADRVRSDYVYPNLRKMYNLLTGRSF